MVPVPRLGQARKSFPVSARELAKIAGVSRTTIVELESGARTGARPDTVRKLAKALKVKPADLMEANA
ncbi:MAG TPA: helix-turn-helix transcriptional regulator [Chloroflexota bacterium]|nr:helix-turn-helix transcriptional regulator [Chloroflexota bacterium]